jgi:hypothetical protein
VESSKCTLLDVDIHACLAAIVGQVTFDDSDAQTIDPA